MSELQQALQEITYFDRHFPEDAFRVIVAHKEEAIPCLREAVEYAIEQGAELDPDYQLHFYAIHLLAEFQDRESFSRIVRLASLDGDTVDAMLGDAITSTLREILYNTCDGNLELLEKSILNETTDEYVKSAMLDVLGQLYLDGRIAEQEWKDFLKQVVYGDIEYSYIHNAVGDMICKCHFVDMLPDIRYLFSRNLLDEMCMGEYDAYVDAMFEYREYDKNFCQTPFCAAESLRHWAMFSEDDKKPKQSKKDMAGLLRAFEREFHAPAKKTKTGRNDPCPCGSGKKYKFCCLNKPKDALDSIESLEERSKCLKGYPYTGPERIDGRIYLEDYFDAESIAADQILYLGLQNRPGILWHRDRDAEKRRSKEYLYLAFQKCRERMEREGIASFKEYDEKYSIHYFCAQWTDVLEQLLIEHGETERQEELQTWKREKG